MSKLENFYVIYFYGPGHQSTDDEWREIDTSVYTNDEEIEEMLSDQFESHHRHVDQYVFHFWRVKKLPSKKVDDDIRRAKNYLKHYTKELERLMKVRDSGTLVDLGEGKEGSIFPKIPSNPFSDRFKAMAYKEPGLGGEVQILEAFHKANLPIDHNIIRSWKHGGEPDPKIRRKVLAVLRKLENKRIKK